MRRLFLAIKAHFLRQCSICDARQRVQAIVPAQSPHLAHLDKQLLVDVSVIIQNDAGTGIQRVVRALLLQLLKNPPAGYSVKPVFCTHQHGYHYAPQDFGSPNYRKIAQAKPEKLPPTKAIFFLVSIYARTYCLSATPSYCTGKPPA
ncbi:hypothetical protein [Deefgea sp. CFH1-16]|uniref:hypothetical protein n=1 Tax=Deefgea sp. CFH1-16 TaxID=2675457 RepID=UPI0015F5762D|nr:hypothetical protein [Deefgea sp. CFH1-16]MBM5574147.1 hypothetical protein [Deefgea sp. CFH1-16]